MWTWIKRVSVWTSTDYDKLLFVAYKNCFKFPDETGGCQMEEHKNNSNSST